MSGFRQVVYGYSMQRREQWRPRRYRVLQQGALCATVVSEHFTRWGAGRALDRRQGRMQPRWEDV